MDHRESAIGDCNPDKKNNLKKKIIIIIIIIIINPWAVIQDWVLNQINTVFLWM